MSEIKSVAVVGLGIGRSHIEEGYARQGERWRVATICDLDPVRLAEVGDMLGIADRTTDFSAVLARPDVDVVDICTPPMTHLPLALAALAAGKHVVCEKPLVGSLADADRLIAAAEASGRMLMPILQYRWGDGAQKARRIIDAGIAGRPYVGTVETHWKRTAEYYAVPWRGKWASELGGLLITHAIHQHDLVTFLMGPVSRLFARLATRVNAIEVEDCMSASWEMANGALVTASATLGSQTEISRLRLCFEKVTFVSGGGCYSPGDDPWEIIPADAGVAAEIAAVLEGFVSQGRRFGGQMAAFHDALCGRAPVPVTPADARATLELATAFYHSAATGTDVLLPLPPDHPKYASWRPDGR